MNNRLQRIEKEMVVALCKVLSWHYVAGHAARYKGENVKSKRVTEFEV
jgi:hypothetical protein